MTTVQATLDQAYRYLLSGQNEQRNQLANDIAADDLTLQLAYPIRGLQEGVTISVDLELMYVWKTDDANRVATVGRGDQGSTPMAHNAGANVFVSPKFSYFQMFAELNDELSSYSSPDNGLYQIKTVDLTASATAVGYDLGDPSVLDVIDVRMEQYAPIKDWPRLDNWELVLHGETTDFPSGVSLEVPDYNVVPGRRLRVRYKAAFTPLAGLSDTLEGIAGLPATAVDIPPLGIAAQLMAVRESKRTFTEAQGDTRRAQEVPPGATLNAARQLQLMRMERLREEANRLSRFFPTYRR